MSPPFRERPTPSHPDRDELARLVRELILRLGGGGRDDAARDEVLRRIARYQTDAVDPYGRLVRARRVAPEATSTMDSIPAVPTDVFRYARVAAHAPEFDVRWFRTSGTTQEATGVAHLRDLSLYDAAARASAKHFLFPDRERMRLIVLAPHESEAPHSSLSYMLTRFDGWFGDDETRWVWDANALDVGGLERELDAAIEEDRPVALLGTSFAFVHALDGLDGRRWGLPGGSRLMQTGGFKGRSRTYEPDEMRDALEHAFGLEPHMIISEYGMTELSSQLYETPLRECVLGLTATPRRLVAPGWTRVTLVDPETLEPVPDGATGVVRIDDAANVDTVAFVQTADLGERLLDGLVVLGRATDAAPRGCSLAVDLALGGDEP